MKQWTPMVMPMLSATILLLTLMFIMPITVKLMKESMSLILEWELFNLNGVIFKVPILLDKMSLTFSITVMVISLSVMMFSSSYMSMDKNLEYFIIMVMMFVFSMNILIFSPHLTTLLLGWDGLGLTSYLLVIYYMNDKSLAAGMMTALTNRIGDSLLILACSWAFISGHWNFMFSSLFTVSMMALSIFLAALTKSAQLPFSAWLPAAMAAPTPVSALVHSSTLVTAGIYILIRFYPSLTKFLFFQSLCFYLGAMTCLMASLAASCESDLKKVIALSTLSQLGVMMICLGLNQPSLSYFHLITHALFKALLFICAGTMIHSNSNIQDIRMMGNMYNSLPLTTAAFNSANLSLCGMPFMAGFYSKDTVVETFLLSNSPLSTSIITMFSVCLTSAYTIKLSIMTLWSPFKGSAMLMNSDESTMTCSAYIILLMGAISSGVLFFWSMNPSMNLLVMPMEMKLITLLLILLLALMMYQQMKNKKLIMGISSLISMWFLTSISSHPLINKTFSMSKIMVYNEYTWMETLSGKGVKSTVKNFSQTLQNFSNMKLSFMMSLFSMSVLMIIMNF